MPKIALSVSYARPEDAQNESNDRLGHYLAALKAAGAEVTTLFLDEWENRALEVVENFDGLVLSGGADLPTDWYGETPLPGANLDLVSDRRPTFEKTLVDGFFKAKKPVLGICYGCQFLNVWAGGSLIQDLELQTGTSLEHGDGNLHPVSLEKNSKLGQIIGENEFNVPSYHHQAIKAIAPGAVVPSKAEDGTSEAIEWPDEKFFLGVQWHPERAPNSSATKKLFGVFVAACEK